MVKKIRTKLTAWKEWKAKLKETSKVAYFVVDNVETLVVALTIALVIREYAFQTSLVFSGSMIPTMQIRDRLIVNKLTFYYSTPKRGDIIVFESPTGDGREFVKRLVGLPSETIEVRRGLIFINNKPITFPGVVIDRDYSAYGPTKIPDDHYFFMGDNRDNSSDSRVWGFVHENDLIGHALFTFWPIQNIQTLR